MRMAPTWRRTGNCAIEPQVRKSPYALEQIECRSGQEDSTSQHSVASLIDAGKFKEFDEVPDLQRGKAKEKQKIRSEMTRFTKVLLYALQEAHVMPDAGQGVVPKQPSRRSLDGKQ